mmetsp:Transcript_23416/g.61874  ORF Transcript_23416/g.61874 Transcript_23416/m.61874 type:complete len:129 (-) Transcript_23416:13-399(-)
MPPLPPPASVAATPPLPAAAAARGERTLWEQVHDAVSGLALGGGLLRSLFDEAALGLDDALAAQMVEIAARQIAASVEARGETSYVLTRGEQQSDERRASAIRRYFSKLVAAAKTERAKGRAPTTVQL